jgi:hypothetical protein
MNVGEAVNLNVLLDWLLERPRYAGRRISEQEAKAAAIRLATAANRALSAGLNGADVETLWTIPARKREARTP